MGHPRSPGFGSWRTPLRATPGAPRAARCRAGPALVESLAAPVTPCWDSPGPTVRDACGRTRGSAAPGGDVSGTDQIALAHMPAVRAGKATPLRLGDGLVARGAGGRGPPLVHEHHLDPCQLGFVSQAGEQVGAPPGAERKVLVPSAVSCGDAPGIADRDRRHSPLHEPR